MELWVIGTKSRIFEKNQTSLSGLRKPWRSQLESTTDHEKLHHISLPDGKNKNEVDLNQCTVTLDKLSNLAL